MENNFSYLSHIGWSPHFQTQFEQLPKGIFVPARVIGVRKNNFYLNNGKNESLATLSGKFKYTINNKNPVVGDWVLIINSVIHRILIRKNVLTRGASGTHNKKNAQLQRGQVIAANLNTVFVVSGLDRDFNLKRIERYLTLVYNCNLNPIIVLTKADLHQDPERFSSKVKTAALDVPIHLVSLLNNTGLTSLETYLPLGCTTTVIGSSGAGKSTLINRLCGKAIRTTNSISSHLNKGKHTTTSRDLVMIHPTKGMIIDNPGIREISLWGLNDGIDITFPEIKKLSLECRFINCNHIHEPGCQIIKAVSEGKISKERLKNYQKMKRELRYLSQSRCKSSSRVEKERWKKISLKSRKYKKK